MACEDFYERSFAALREVNGSNYGSSIADVVDREHAWTNVFDHWIALDTSHDPDQVSATDLCNYQKTGEDWPVKEGFGCLIALMASGLPIQLNAAVRQIHHSGKDIRVATARGTLKAKAVFVTVSTEILAGGDILFIPELPVWKRQAIADLPLGCHNRIGWFFDRNVFGDDHPRDMTFLSSTSEPMGFHLRPFGLN